MAARPKPSDRLGEAVLRLRHNPDFTQLRDHLKAELEYVKDCLVVQADPHAFGQMQGRALQLKDMLELITKE